MKQTKAAKKTIFEQEDDMQRLAQTLVGKRFFTFTLHLPKMGSAGRIKPHSDINIDLTGAYLDSADTFVLGPVKKLSGRRKIPSKPRTPTFLQQTNSPYVTRLSMPGMQAMLAQPGTATLFWSCAWSHPVPGSLRAIFQAILSDESDDDSRNFDSGQLIDHEGEPCLALDLTTCKVKGGSEFKIMTFLGSDGKIRTDLIVPKGITRGDLPIS